MNEFSYLPVDKIIELGRDYGKELDDSLSKSNMIEQLKEHVCSLSKDELDTLSKIES